MTEKDYVALNREGWTKANAEYTDRTARDSWAQEEITYGKWSIPERELRVLPDVKDKLAAQGVIAVGNPSAEFSAYVEREIERWGKVIKATGIKIK